MANNILELLKTECHFSQVFEGKDRPEGCWDDIPRKKIGHIRADYDGFRWWSTVWPGHKELASAEITAEIDRGDVFGPRRSPAKRVRWGEEEGMERAEPSPSGGDGAERNFF